MDLDLIVEGLRKKLSENSGFLDFGRWVVVHIERGEADNQVIFFLDDGTRVPMTVTERDNRLFFRGDRRAVSVPATEILGKPN